MENKKLLGKTKNNENELNGNSEQSFSVNDPPHQEEEIHGYPTLDNILNKIGYTNYHIFLITGCCLFYFSQGAQIYSFNLLMPIFNVVLRLNQLEHVILSSICYFGYAFGSLFVGTLTKYFNRKMPILVSLAVYSVFTILVILYQDFYWIMICRFIIGFCIGIVSSLYLSHMSEYLPIYYREVTIGIVLCCYILGILFYVISFKFLMPNYQKFEEWKLILLVISIPCIFSTVFSILIVRDSARLLLNKEQFEEGILELRTLTLRTTYIMNENDEENLKKEMLAAKSKRIEFSFMMLFNDKFLLLTTVNLILMVTTSSTYVSNFYSLPLILYKEKKRHSEMFYEIIIAQSFSIPSILLASFLATMPSLGRKYTISIGFAVCVCVSFMAASLKTGLLVCCSLINFFIFASYFLSKVYLIESFPSKLRDHGMSIIFVTARLAESLSPSLCEMMFKWFEYGPLVWIGLICFIGMIFSFLIPFETRGEAIDSKI